MRSSNSNDVNTGTSESIEVSSKQKRVRKPVTDDEEQRILSMLFEGRVPYQIAQICGRDRGVVMRIARIHKRELCEVVQNRLRMKGDTIDDGLTAYTRYLKSENRQAMLSQSLDKVERMLQRQNLPAKDVRDLMVSVGIIVDKFAVETGKADPNAKSALIAMFAKMEQNNTVNNNGFTSTRGEAGKLHPIETETNEYTVGKLEEQQVNSS